MSTLQIRKTASRLDDYAKLVEYYPVLPKELNKTAFDRMITLLLSQAQQKD